MEKGRNSNIELLRIISIILIVVSHYCTHGGVVTSDLELGINRFILEAFKLGHLGLILFVLIAGYFLINSKGIKIKKVLRLIFQVVFYSITIYLILLLLRVEPFSFKSLIMNILPISFNQYWFATAYVMLYLFHPYINRLLNSLSRKEHLVFIMAMFSIISVLHTLTTGEYYGNELVQFIMFYSIGAYLNKYPDNILKDHNNNIKLLIASLLTIVLSIIGFDILGNFINIFGMHSTYLLNRTSPPAILLCISLFDIFTRKKHFSNKFINLISSLIFGVYLISDNELLRPIIWINIFKNSQFATSPFLAIHMLLAVTITIIICLCIEYIRKTVFEKTLFNLIDQKIDSLQNKITKYINQQIRLD